MASLGYIQVTRRCNQQCRFCSNPQNERELDLAKAKRLVDSYHRRGYDGVILTGGEPTLYEPLPALIAHASHRAIHCRIITNAQRTADHAYMDGLVRSGLCHIHVSVHSHRREVQAFLTGNPDSLANIIRTLAFLRRHAMDVNINQTICAQNSEHIHQTVRWLCERFPNIRHFSWTFLDTLTERVAKHPETIPTLRGSRRSLLLAMRCLAHTNRTFRLEKVPLCYMGEFSHCSTETRAIVKSEELAIDFLDGREHFQTRNWYVKYGKAEVCRRCALESICTGLFDMGRGYDPDELIPQKMSPRPIIQRILGPS